jgi:hypothetical protein
VPLTLAPRRAGGHRSTDDVSDDRLSMRLGRAYLRAAIPCVVLGGALFLLLYLTVLPPPGGKVDLARAKLIVSRQWYVPVIAIHAVLLMSGLIRPWVRGDRPARAAIAGLAGLPAIWIHVVAAQLVVALGLVAGVAPGVLALAPAALVAAAVADGARGRAAFTAAADAARSRRWRIATLVAGLIALEVILTIAMWKALVPPLGKKTPPAGLIDASRFAYLNAIRTAITAPVVATLFAALYPTRQPQAASAARTAPASAHAATS